MSQIMFLATSTANSILFSQMKHPMNMGILLLLQTVLMCLTTGMMSKTSWFSYILFLVFLGGMLVLFIYMTSVASNEIFQKTNYNILIWLVMLILLGITTMIIMLDPTSLPNNSTETVPMESSWSNENSKMLIMLFNYPSNIMTVFMVLYLFITLIVVVKITDTNQGPLRSKI